MRNVLRRHRWLRGLAAGTAIAAVVGGAAFAVGQLDPGRAYENRLANQSQTIFGFGKPLDHGAFGTFSGPGNKAVEVAKGLHVQLVSDKIGKDGDMIALWPNDRHPRWAIICNEIDSTESSQASVQRVRLSDGAVFDMVFGHVSCDPSHRTAWGTIVIGEENGPDGRLWEILNPKSVNGVTVDPVAGTSSDETHVVARKALGQLSYEGVVLLPDGTTYYADELRPFEGAAGGGMYKFIPDNPFAGPGHLSSLDESPLVSGIVHVMRLGIREDNTDWGQGSNVGAGVWVPLTTPSDPTTWNLDADAKTVGATGYYRPEDLDLDPMAWRNGHIRMCFNNTGNDAAENWGETLCLEDRADATAETGHQPVISQFMVGDPDLRMPDNLDFQPRTGILYILMDATTSVDDPAFSNDSVWACLPDGADHNLLTDGCVRVMNLLDGEAEFTGIEFFRGGHRFLVHLQHRTDEGRADPETTDLIMVSGLK